MASVAEIFETMAYGPAPESGRAGAGLARAARAGTFGQFIGGAWTKPGRRAPSRRINPATGKPLAQARRRRRGRRRRGGGARRARRCPAWRALGGHGRARYLYALARQVQKHAAAASPCSRRSTTASRSARRATSTCRWWRGTSTTTPAGRSCMEREFPGYGAGRRRRPDHPVELPAADAGLEDRAGARHGQHGGAQAGRVHLAHRAAASPSSAHEVGLPAGVVNIVTGDGAHRRGARRSTRTSTRSPSPARPRSAGSSARRPPAAARSSRSSWAASRPFIVFDDADLDSVVEGVVDAIWFNQGQVCCAGSRLLVQEGIAERAGRASCGRAWRRCASGDPLDKAVDIGAIVAPVQLERIQRAGRSRASTRARRCWQPSWSCPTRGLLLSRRRCSPTSRPSATIAQVEIFGPVLVAMTFRTPAEAVELANNTPLRPGRERLDARTSTWRSTSRRKLKAGTVWINCTNLFDAAVRLRRLPRERLRPRGRARRACASM